MRRLSLADTLPSKTRRSVPRLSPDQSVRTRASFAPRAGSSAGRSSASRRPTYQSASALFCAAWSAEPWPFIGASGFLRFITPIPCPRRFMTEPAQLLPTLDLVGLTSTTPTRGPVHGAASQAAPLHGRRERCDLSRHSPRPWPSSSAPAAGHAVDVILFGCFLIATPWTVLGFWNAVIGLWLLHGSEGRHRRRSRPSPPQGSAATRSMPAPPS